MAKLFLSWFECVKCSCTKSNRSFFLTPAHEEVDVLVIQMGVVDFRNANEEAHIVVLKGLDDLHIIGRP